MKPKLHPSITPLLLFCVLGASLVKSHAQDARFKRFDKDGNGKISREEAKGTAAEARFDELDKNKDGFLTPDEVPRGRAAAPMPADNAAPAIVTKMDIRYAEVPPGVDANPLSLDVYAPKDAKNLPVMIYIHGGGWRTGDKSAVGLKPAYFTGRGFVFVSLNYRLVPAVDILTQFQDSANAIGWVKKNIAQHGGDPARLHLIGHSAGAHHVAILATNGRFLEKAGVSLSDLRSVVELDTQALDVPDMMKDNTNDLYTQAFGKDPEVWKQVSPRDNVAKDKSIPPFFLVVADDRGPKLAQAAAFQKSLQAAGVRCEFVEAPQHDHGSLNRAIGDKADKVTQAMEQFHDLVLGLKKSAASPQTKPPGDSWFIEAARFDPPQARAGAVFDVDDDGFDDVVSVGGDQFLVIANRKANENARVFEPVGHRLPDADQVRRNVQALSLHGFDNDGRLDLLLGETGGDGSIQLPARVDPAKHGGSVRLNMGDFSFKARSLGNDSYGSTRSVIFDDFDRDGHADSYHSVAAYWNASPLANRLLPGTADWDKFGNDVIERMLPDPAFFRDAQGRGIKDFKACIARDFDADGKTDLVTGMMAEIETDPGGPYASWMRGLAVLHNESMPSSIRFADVSHEAIPRAYSDGTKYPQMHVYAIVALDFERDGRLDLFVTGSRSPAAHLSLESNTDLLRLYRNESRPGQIRFRDVPEQAGLSFFNDQRVARVFPEAPQLFPQLAAGVPANVDNDGYMDVVHVNRRAFHRGDTLSDFVWRNNGGGGFDFVPFDQHGLTGTAREISVGDFNADGQVDIALFHDKAVRLYLNRQSNANHWIKLKVGWAENRLGVGSRIAVYESGTKTLIGYDEVRTDVCYRSRRSTSLHFGLGNAKEVDVHVVAPDGRQQRFEKLPADRLHVLDVNQAVAWEPSLPFDAETTKEGPLPVNAMQLVTHRGMLFCGMATSYERARYSSGSSYIYSKASAEAPWKLEADFGPGTSRVGQMFSARFEHDDHGKPIPGGPQEVLAALTMSLARRGGEATPLQMRVRDDATGQWHTHDLPTPKVADANVRELWLHRDRVTGADLLFVAANPSPLGLHAGVFDASAPGRIRWRSEPEIAAQGQRGTSKWFGMATVNGILLASDRHAVYRRDDGPQPKWTKVVQFPRASDEEGSGVRGLTAVPNPPAITGWPEKEMALFGTQMKLWRVRVPTDTGVKHEHIAELDLVPWFAEKTGEPIAFAESAFNRLTSYRPAPDAAPVWPIGFQVVYPVPGKTLSNNDLKSFRLKDDAWYLLRDENANYTLHRIASDRRLFLARDFKPSPFATEPHTLYACGYNGFYFKGSLGTAWVYKGTVTSK